MVAHQERVNSWLKDLGNRTGLNLELSDEGLCAVGYGNTLDCAIEVPSHVPAVYLYSSLMTLPAEGLETFYRELLQFNLLGMETSGASFAIDADDNSVVFWITRSIENLDQVAFESLLGSYLEQAEKWQRDLSRAGQDDGQADKPEEDSIDPLANLQFRA